MTAATPPAHDPYAALRLPEYRSFCLGRNLSALGDTMQSVVIGWELYQRTGQPMTLGWVGLIQAAPIFLFALHAGHIADAYSRKRIAILAQIAFCFCSVAMAGFSATKAPLPWFYLCLFCAATARAFGNPARGALLPQIVPMRLLGSAISWDTSLRRITVMSGAALGGWVLAWLPQPAFVYLLTAALGVLSAGMLGLIAEKTPTERKREPATWATLLAGIVYIKSTKIVLATISLDLFAVLLGGATTLLPVYAKDILRVGPEGFGWLRAAPSAGALLMALWLAHLPPFRYPGRTMLWAVFGFGVATIVFGVSRSLWVSMAALFAGGALDMISVVVRQTLIQSLTPDAMRGRVNAVNSVFISSSNEIGGFESGLVAQLVSPMFSVVSGGIGTLAVVVGTALFAPTVLNYSTATRPDDAEKEEPVAS